MAFLLRSHDPLRTWIPLHHSTTRTNAYYLFTAGQTCDGTARQNCSLVSAARNPNAVAQRAAAAQAAITAGRFDEAIALASSVVEIETQNFQAWMWFGDMLLRANRPEQAVPAFAHASSLNPYHSAPFTRLATLRFRLAYGAPPVPRAAKGAARIQCRCLGSDGRFGNQLLQYAFVTLCARRHDLEAEIPDWIGRDLYDLDDPLPGPPLALRRETDTDLLSALRGATEIGANFDVQGYFCGPMADWGESAEPFRALYRLGKRVAPHIATALAKLRARGRTLIAIHMRRGDYGVGRFWIAPSGWYRSWLREIWATLEQPVLYVASDAPAVVGEFAEFAPVAASDLGIDIAGAPFLVDFEVLRQADRIAISNSSFSYVAALLNAQATVFMRPDPDQRGLRPFQPWRERVLLDPIPTTGSISAAEASFLDRVLRPGLNVVRVGEVCAPAAHEFRLRYPNIRLHELEPSSSVDAWRSASVRPHIDLLILEHGADLDHLVRATAARSLDLARIDHLLVPGTGLGSAAAAALALKGYIWRALAASGVSPGTVSPVPGEGFYLAEHARLAALVEGRREELDVVDLCRRHGVGVDAVLHIGAHEGQELAKYDALGARNVVFVEANPEVYRRLASRLASRDDVHCVQRAVGAAPGKALLHLASFDQSSSLLPMDGHRLVYPSIVPAGTVEVEVVTLDALVAELELPPARISLLSIDVQGAELLVLQGATVVLPHVGAILVEVSFMPLYRGGAQIDEIDDLLSASGFRRVALVSAWHASWGDAFYIRV